jgi:hypothetical protein
MKSEVNKQTYLTIMIKPSIEWCETVTNASIDYTSFTQENG